MMRKKFSIQMKIILISVIILAIPVISILLISGIIFKSEYSQILKINALVITRNLHCDLNTGLGNENELENIKGFGNRCREFVYTYNDLSYAMVVDVNGKILFHNDPGSQDKTLYTKAEWEALANTSYRVITATHNNKRYYEVHIPVFSLSSHYMGAVCTGFPLEKISGKLNDIFLTSTVIAVISFGISQLLAGIALSRWITKPLTNLVAEIQEIRRKKTLAQRVFIHSHDEIGELTEIINKMLEELAWNQKLYIENERIAKELEIARIIQTSLLPQHDALDDDQYDIFAMMIPAADAGGDYYDIIRDKNGRLWFGIGDVTGHGIQSSLIMMMLQTATFSYINDNPEITPGELAAKTNRVLYENIRKRLKLKNFMTLSYFVCNAEGDFQFAGKHLPAVIYRSQSRQCEMIDVKGFWAGILPEIEDRIMTMNFKLHQDDILILYSDGIIEAMDNQYTQYGFDRFLNSLNEHCRDIKSQAQGIVTKIINDLFMFMENQKDDLSLLVIRKR